MNKRKALKRNFQGQSDDDEEEEEVETGYARIMQMSTKLEVDDLRRLSGRIKIS